MDAGAVEALWQQCRDWLPEFDGASDEVWLLGIDRAGLMRGLELLRDGARSLSIREPTWHHDHDGGAATAELGDLPDLLAAGDAVLCTLHCVTDLPGFRLETTLLIDRGDAGFDVDMLWWADEVFAAEVNARRRFGQLLHHVSELRAAFGCERAFLGRESYPRPPAGGSWLPLP